MHYDPVTLVNNIFNKIEDLLEYEDMENCHYSHPQEIFNAYDIFNSTEKFESPSSPRIVSL